MEIEVVFTHFVVILSLAQARPTATGAFLDRKDMVFE